MSKILAFARIARLFVVCLVADRLGRSKRAVG